MKQEAKQKQIFSRRWPIFFWFGAIFCFVIFPLFLFEEGVRSLLETNSEVKKQQLYEKLNNKLEQLLHYKESSYYYHALLKLMFDRAKSSKNPLKYLKKAIPHLKNRNPDTFKFVVWDQKGAIVSQITDEKGYKYILKTMYRVFKEVAEECKNNYPGFPETIPIVEKRLNLLRSYLGSFLIPENLNATYLHSNLGRTILSSAEIDKANFWFQIDKKFGIFCSISKNAIESNHSAKSIIQLLNKSSTNGIRTGIVEILDNDKAFYGVEERYKKEILIELGKFENVSEQQLETKNLLLIIKMLNPFVRSFCYVPKAGRISDPNSQYWLILGIASTLLFIAGALFWWLIFKSRHIFSIRWKLILLFAYANGLPLLILGFLGYEYLQQKRVLLINQVQNESYQLLLDFDSKFTKIKKDFADELNQQISDLNIKYKGKKPPEKVLQNLIDSWKHMNFSDFYLVSKQGKTAEISGSKKKSVAFIAHMGMQLLTYLNATTFTPKENLSEQFRESEEIRAATFVTSKTLVYDLILYKIGKLVEEQMGTERKIYYWNYLCTPGKRDFTHLIAILWYVDSLQESYIKSYIDDLNKNKDGFKCFAMSQTNGLIYPIGSKVTSSLANLFSQSFSAKVTKSSQLEYDSKTYVAYGSQGKLLNSAAMVALFPREKIDNQVNFIKLKLIIFALLSFGLTTGIGRVLAIQFLEPVKDLGIGVKAIGKQDFRHRIPIKTADEFGKLGTVFNRAIESLGELEVAKIVQENLFPGENLNQNNLEVFGKSVSMTRLGGDYYDFFPIDKEKTGILMGDVAGHGVPAALIMSMAKASVLMSDTEKRNPAEMMSYLHKVIRSVKSKTIKRMMTCQYFYFDSVSGEFEFANAGHCFPLLIKNKGKTIEQLKLIGTPLGITKRARYTNEKAFMEPGDVMLLYTDGIIESKDSAGNDMGFDNFFELTKNAYSEKLEDFYQNLYNAYLNWSPIADDDITMVLIKLHKEETNG